MVLYKREGYVVMNVIVYVKYFIYICLIGTHVR
jgi:hypothetical protein